MHFHLQRVWEASDWQNSAWISFLAKSRENIWYSQQAETFQCLRPPVPFRPLQSGSPWLSTGTPAAFTTVAAPGSLAPSQMRRLVSHGSADTGAHTPGRLACYTEKISSLFAFPHV